MGAFSKIFKGIKKGFKKIGKGVKGAFQKFGKFMGKIGILGQLAMMFILPGIGNALFNSFKGLLQTAWTSSLKGLTALGKGAGLGAKIAKAASWTMEQAQRFASYGVEGYKTVTEGVTKFFEHTGKYVGGKLGIAELPNVTAGEAWQNYQGDMVKQWDKFTKAGTDLVSPGIKDAVGSDDITVSKSAEKVTARAKGDKTVTYDFEKPSADLTAVGESGYYQDSAGNLYGSPSEQGWHVRADASAAAGGRLSDVAFDPEVTYGRGRASPQGPRMTYADKPTTRFKEYLAGIPGQMVDATTSMITDLPETTIKGIGSAKIASLMAEDIDYQRGGVYQPFEARDYTSGTWERGMASRQAEESDPYLRGIPITGFGEPGGFWGPPVYQSYMKRFAS
jgi:hypothetical protein